MGKVNGAQGFDEPWLLREPDQCAAGESLACDGRGQWAHRISVKH